MNKDQEKKTQECKEQLTDKNSEVIKLRHEIAQLTDRVQTCPSSTAVESTDGSDLISLSREPGIQKVFTNDIEGA